MSKHKDPLHAAVPPISLVIAVLTILLGFGFWLLFFGSNLSTDVILTPVASPSISSDLRNT